MLMFSVFCASQALCMRILSSSHEPLVFFAPATADGLTEKQKGNRQGTERCEWIWHIPWIVVINLVPQPVKHGVPTRHDLVCVRVEYGAGLVLVDDDDVYGPRAAGLVWRRGKLLLVSLCLHDSDGGLDWMRRAVKVPLAGALVWAC
jgi:hypothetical protein